MTKTCKSQSGFAIGTILLAVVLIAAIVSAIAIASRGTTNQSGREQSRINATTVIQQGINLKQGYDRLMANGIDRTNIVIGAPAATPGTTVGTNAAGTVNCTGATAPNVCLFDNPNGGTATQVPPQQAVELGAANNPNPLRYKRMAGVTVPGIGSTVGNDIVIYLTDISRQVCQQINNVSSGNLIPSNANPPVPTTLLAAGALTPANETAGFDLTGIETTANFNTQEGCVRIIGAAEDETSTYMYFRVVSEG
ncbi:MAG: hypothetical protein AB7U41_07025 [Dongiaceae bacterium]